LIYLGNFNFIKIETENNLIISYHHNLILRIRKMSLISKVVKMKKEVPECVVCVESLNNSTRIAVECGSCSYIACKTCYKRYFTETFENPHCMKCKKEWDYKIMVDKFDRKFIDTKYKEHRENILIDREKGLMVATQPQVEHIILNEQRLKQIEELRQQRYELNRQENLIFTAMNRPLGNERKVFIRKCTKEDCRGFLSSQWKCGLCDSWSCPDCHDFIGSDKTTHQCHPDTLATAKLMDQDTKTCPKCSTGIFKIDGCDMMFCTSCHTSFSWRTGKIETGIIHNPHYFEWLHNSGTVIERNPNEIRCGREIDQYFINSDLLHNITRFKDIFDKDAAKLIRIRAVNLIHMRHIDLPMFAVDDINDNVDLRICYMRNKIDEITFKRLLQQREKRNYKKREYFNIFNMFVSCQTEIFYRIIDTCETDKHNKTSTFASKEDSIRKILLESNNLLLYTNDVLSAFASLNKSTKHDINNVFTRMQG
jgi:hypothetical protein